MSYIGNIYGEKETIEVSVQCYCIHDDCEARHCTLN